MISRVSFNSAPIIQPGQNNQSIQPVKSNQNLTGIKLSGLNADQVSFRGYPFIKKVRDETSAFLEEAKQKGKTGTIVDICFVKTVNSSKDVERIATGKAPGLKKFYDSLRFFQGNHFNSEYFVPLNTPLEQLKIEKIEADRQFNADMYAEKERIQNAVPLFGTLISAYVDWHARKERSEKLNNYDSVSKLREPLEAMVKLVIEKYENDLIPPGYQKRVGELEFFDDKECGPKSPKEIKEKGIVVVPGEKDPIKILEKYYMYRATTVYGNYIKEDDPSHPKRFAILKVMNGGLALPKVKFRF